MKRFYRIFASWFLCLFLVLSQFIVSFADVKSLMIGSDSNALMTLDLDDSDYLMMSPRSSIGTVKNTVIKNDGSIWFTARASNGTSTINYVSQVNYEDGRYVIRNKTPLDGYYYNRFWFSISKDSLPPVGGYMMSFDFASDFSYEITSCTLTSLKNTSNATTIDDTVSLQYTASSGDIYIAPFELDLTSSDRLSLNFTVKGTQLKNFAGNFAVNFTPYDVSDSAITTVGGITTTQDYENDVSSSLSDLSSSVSDMTSEISGVTSAIEALAGAMEPHYNNVLTQLHHITEQLHALWDQQYNLHHVPLMAKLDEIKTAIGNMDLQVVVELDGLKQTVNKVATDIMSNDNKISSDQIANNEENTEEVKEAVKEHGNFIIDGLKGLFIPSDEFFKSYFDDLFSWFSDRFGFLSFPIDLLARVVDLFVNSSGTDCVLTLPSFQISGEQLLYEQSFNLTDFLEQNFAFLLSAIRMVSSIGLIMAFVNLCSDKWNEVMRN